MATEALKSDAITSLDTSPVVRLVPGAGGEAHLRVASGYVTAVTAKDNASTYQMCRVPSRAIIKQVKLSLDAAVTTFTVDVGWYYSTSTTDGTPAASQGTAVNTTSGSQLHGTAIALASIVVPTEYTNESTNYTAAKRQQPVWQACGLTTNPGGYFDLTLTTTTTNSGGPVVYAEVQYAMPGS